MGMPETFIEPMKPLNDLGLPHGPEFRFVDVASILEPGSRGRGSYLIRGDEAFLKAHFPGNPIMPGVLMIEAIAQLAGVVAQSDQGIEPLQNLRLTSVRGIKILDSASPGEELEIEVEILARMGNLVQASGCVSVGTRKLAEGQVTLSGQLES